MALPNNPKKIWPPEEWQPVYEKYEEHSAWYSGAAARLAEVYSRRVYNPTPRGRF